MKPLFFLKSILSEALIILLLIFIYNNFLGNAKITIGADGLGYYDYLPSIFIHNDLDRRDKDIKTDSSSFARILNTGVYVTYHGDFLVNKYPCGTALLESPFFLFTWLSVKKENAVLKGYEEPFQRTIFHAAIFYLLLSLFFLRKTLKLYKINSSYIFFTQLVLVLGTSITHYVNQDASFRHIYSLFAITAFIYFVKLYPAFGVVAMRRLKAMA